MEITGSSLSFKRLSAGDFHLYSLLVTDPDVMKYITGKALSPAEAESRFRHALRLTESNPGAGYFVVSSTQSGEFAGVAKLVLTKENQFEIGYMLMPEHWNKGYASGIVESLVNYARENNLCREIIGIVDPANPASIRVLTKHGFTLYETGLLDGLEAAYYKLLL